MSAPPDPLALPLAVVGILGCAVIGRTTQTTTQTARIWIVGTVLAACLLGLGYQGLSHPVVDPITPEICADLG